MRYISSRQEWVRKRMRRSDIYSIAGSCVMGKEKLLHAGSCSTGEADEAK